MGRDGMPLGEGTNYRWSSQMADQMAALDGKDSNRLPADGGLELPHGTPLKDNTHT